MKLNLPDVTSVGSVSVINSNFAAIEQELQNKVLYRNNPDGEPNTLETPLDANGKEIYNVSTMRTTDLYIDGEKVVPSGVVVVEGETDISGLLVKTANLSDVQSAATSRVNLGLGNVDNTSDVNKPISTAVSSALSGKQATLVSGVNIKTINSNSIVGSGDLVLTGVGETNTTSNLGSGQGLAAPKSGTNLPFKSLVAGTNVTLTPTANDVTINATVNTSALLVKASNLSDVQSAATSRTNLGLGNVDNTTDLNKPISTATSSALAGKQATLVSGTNIKTINGSTLLGSGDLVVSGTGGDFLQAGAGAVTRTMQNARRDIYSVKDFGAVADGVTNDYAAIQAAIDALPAEGGTILFPHGNYVVNTVPNPGTKSLYVDISPGCVFSGAGTGAGKFPYMTSNHGQLAVGPYVRSQTMQKSTNSNGGVAAFQAEMLQPAGYGAGQSVAGYFGAMTNNPTPGGNIWAINPLIQVGSSVPAGSSCQCAEFDIDNDSVNGLVKGITISGYSSAAPTIGIEILMNNTKWKRGIDIRNSTVGMWIYTDTVPQGIVIGQPGQTSNTAISAEQVIGGGDTLILQRKGASGHFIRGVNETNSANLFIVDCAGNMVVAGTSTFTGFSSFNGGMGTTSMILTSGSGTVPAGYFSMGNSTAASASAGASGSLPGTVAGYWVFFIGSTPFKIPYYNN
jgi:hypothetical protein